MDSTTIITDIARKRFWAEPQISATLMRDDATPPFWTECLTALGNKMHSRQLAEISWKGELQELRQNINHMLNICEKIDRVITALHYLCTYLSGQENWSAAMLECCGVYGRGWGNFLRLPLERLTAERVRFEHTEACSTLNIENNVNEKTELWKCNKSFPGKDQRCIYFVNYSMAKLQISHTWEYCIFGFLDLHQDLLPV